MPTSIPINSTTKNNNRKKFNKPILYIKFQNIQDKTLIKLLS